MFKLSWIKKISYIYLAFPFALFLFGWLNRIAAFVVLLVLLTGMFNLWRINETDESLSFTRKDLIFTLLLILAWLFLSGVGGYSFQNWDHHSRNALFRDLIENPWPVVYHFPADIALKFSLSSSLILSYYFGFWLPSALIGKLWGWNAANFFLFLWSFLGIALAVTLTASKIKLSLFKSSLLVVFFSGLDFLGALLFQGAPLYEYPKIFPPIQHLEWWAGPFGSLQYSSFTTDLFWTYNQFIPALLVLALFVTSHSTRTHIFLAGICFFFAPLPALGFSLFIAGALLVDFLDAIKQTTVGFRYFLSNSIVTFESAAGLMVGIVSFLFFSTNIAGQRQSLGLPSPVLLYLIFLFLEGGLVWVVLLSANKKNWMWYLSGVVLVLAPFINIGGSWDFMMRATIPSLYILMIGCGVYLSSGNSDKVKLTLLILLVLGALTPVYEMNRSVVRLIRYYEIPVPSSISFENYFDNPPEIDQWLVPELDHPSTLVADEWVSISIPNTEGGWATKAGELFPASYRFLWKGTLIK